MGVITSALSIVAAAIGTVAPAPAGALTPAVSVLGHSDLGGQGANGQVAVVGNTAIVGAGFLASSAAHASFYNPMKCPTVSVKVVDISDPTHPIVASTIPVPPGVAALDVAALHVTTPSFTGDLAAVALALCGAAGNFVDRGVAYYDVSNRNQPQFLGRYIADSELIDPSLPPCGPGAGGNCASSQHDVSLVQRPNGQVLSLSTEPFASSSGFPSGDLRIVDVTNPANPVQVGSFPANPVPAFSNNGCRPFNAGHSADPSADGSTALLAYLDQGVFNLDLTNPAAPTALGQFSYPPTRTVEGNAGYATFAGTARPLGLVSEEDWIAPDSGLVVIAPNIAGLKPACEAMFTLFDPNNSAQVYRHTGSHVVGEIAYLGRGCPQSAGSTGPDPYLSNPAGKIALIDRSRTAYQPSLPGNFCSFSDKVRRAQQAGAIGVVFAQTAGTAAFSPDGDTTGINIPAYMIEKADGDALRPAACPSLAGGSCVVSQPARGVMLDRPGQWGALRVLNLSNPSAPVTIGSYQTPHGRMFPPPDLGVYAPSRAAASGDLAYVAWNSDGLRVLNVASGRPYELGAFVPPDTADPTGTIPSKAYVQGVASAGCGRVVITDVNSGLYVLSVPASSPCQVVAAPSVKGASQAPAHVPTAVLVPASFPGPAGDPDSGVATNR